MEKLVCTGCGVAKNAISFQHRWQKDHALCNVCNSKNYGLTAVHRDKNKDKEVKCLRCDCSFLGRKNVRICDTCKGMSSFKEDCYMQHVFSR